MKESLNKGLRPMASNPKAMDDLNNILKEREKFIQSSRCYIKY